MTIELLYTSAAQGLKQGSRGFCTVVCTAGLPINLAQRLEALSGYRHLYQPGDVKADENPVCHSHIRLVVGGKTLSIVSRVAAYGVDYSQRTNKIAHHVVFDGSVPSCGPAAVLAQSTVMRATWDGECRTLASGPVFPPMSLQPAPCQHWQRMAGDAGWAGVVANAWLQPTGKPVWIIFSESQSQSLLMLMQEATALLPESRRWQATFSTYCTNLPPDVECRVRCVVAGSDEARMSIARGVVFDLTRPLGMAPENEAAEAARNGFVIGNKTSSIPAVASSQDSYEEPEDDFETAFAKGTNGEEDYGLQPRLPSVAPILLKSPKNRGKLKAKKNNDEPQARYFTNRALLMAIVGVAISFSLLGGGAIWFATSNPLAGIVEGETATKEKEIAKLPPPPPPVDSSKSEQIAEKGTKSSKDASATPLKSKVEIPDLSISQNIKEIDENVDVNPEIEVALVEITNPNAVNLEVSMESEYFRYHDRKIFFKFPPVRYDFETTPELEGTVKFEAKELEFLDRRKFTVKVKDLVEHKLEFTISTEDGQPNPSSVFEGTKLVANVNAGSIDLNETTPSKRGFAWKGRNGANAWTAISNSRDIVASSEFSEVCCELQYSHNSQSPITVKPVQSEPIKINPTGKAEVKFSSIFEGQDLKMSISVPFPHLAYEEGMTYRFRWAGNDSYLSEGRLDLMLNLDAFDSSSGEKNSFTSTMIAIPPNQIHTATQWLQRAVSHSNQVKVNLVMLKSTVKAIKNSPETPSLVRAFYQFVNQIKAEPSEDFFGAVEYAGEWINKCIAFKSLVAEIKKAEDEKNPERNEERINQLRQEKKEVLEDLANKYIAAFKVSRKNLLPSNEVERAILEFASVWEKDVKAASNTSANARMMSKLVPASKGLADLVESIRTLRRTIDSSHEFETTLESVDSIKIRKIQAKKTISGDLESRELPRDSLLEDRVFRVRTGVVFDGVNPSKDKVEGDGGLTNSQSIPNSASSNRPTKDAVTNVREDK